MKIDRASVSFPTPMLADLKQEAKERDLSLSQLIREYVRRGGFRGTQLDLLREDSTDDDSR